MIRVLEIHAAEGGDDSKLFVADLATAYERLFERPWLDHVYWWGERQMHPGENMPDYAQSTSRAVGEASLDAVARSLASGAWFPLTRSARTDGVDAALDEAFRAGYVKEAALYGHAAFAQRVLDTATLLI